MKVPGLWTTDIDTVSLSHVDADDSRLGTAKYALPINDPPLFFERPHGQRPAPEETGGSEEYLLHSINRGRGVISAHRALGWLWSELVAELRTPAWTEPETYYEAITDILQAADHVGLDAEGLCRVAISHQRGFKDEAVTIARDLRGKDG